jgi:hypothetical protein
MSVRAKFKVNANEVTGDLASVQLLPVYEGSDENKEFFGATPGGEILLTIVNAAASDQFVVGGEMYVDFTPAD